MQFCQDLGQNHWVQSALPMKSNLAKCGNRCCFWDYRGQKLCRTIWQNQHLKLQRKDVEVCLQKKTCKLTCVELGDADDRAVDWICLSGDQGLNCLHHSCSRHYWIGGQVRHGSMATSALHDCLKARRRSHDSSSLRDASEVLALDTNILLPLRQLSVVFSSLF